MSEREASRVSRREFLQLAAAVPLLTAHARPFLHPAGAPGAAIPYGGLLAPDEHGLMLPPGFRAREIARAGQVVGGTGFPWHPRPDGGGTFARPDSGWIYVSNSEVDDQQGGVSAVRFAPDGAVLDAYSICSGTSRNCAGGVTSWGTWLTCEEVDGGQVYECDPSGEQPARVRPALGAFRHEAVACDPMDRRLYLTEDDERGRLYRFTPTQWGNLDTGTLEVAQTSDTGTVTWIPATSGEATPYAGGEGIAYYDGRVIFTTKSDQRVRAYDTRTRRMRVLYEPGQSPEVRGPDNVGIAPNGDTYVCEDTDTQQDLVLFGADGRHTEFLRLDASHEGSELAGVAFSPAGDRLYVSSQVGGGDGITYEVVGPFRTGAASVFSSTAPTSDTPTSSPTTGTAPTTGLAHGRTDDTGGADADDDSMVPVVTVAGGAAALVLGGLAWLRHRRGTTPA